MPMSLEEYRRRFPDRPEPIPLEYQGKWIAWDEGHRNIIASADDLPDVRKLVMAMGHTDPIYQFVARYPSFGFQSLRLHNKVTG